MNIIKILSLLFYFSTAESATITLRTDTWCPYACDPKSKKPGFMIEIAKEAFKKAGHIVQYENMNWPRAVADVKSGKYDGLVACSKADVPDFIFPNVPTGMTTTYIYTLKDSNWTYRNRDSLKNKKIGIINNYTYGDEIDKLINEKNSSLKSVSGEDPLLRLIQMTISKRLDGFIENPLVLDYTLNKIKKDKGIFSIASMDFSINPQLFIAFSPTNPKSKEYAKILDDGVIELRKSGRLKEILSKYGLSDWANK